MRKWLSKVGGLVVVAVALFGLSLPASAQTNNHPSAKKTAAAKRQAANKKARPVPFRGAITKIDKASMEIVVGKRTFYLNAGSKVFRGPKPTTLADGKPGEWVTGSYQKEQNGKLLVHTIYFGGKTGTQTGAKEKAKGSKAKPAKKKSETQSSP